MTLDERFAAALDRILADASPQRLAAAVSGGGDSMALLHLAAAWGRQRGIALEAVTVDHGLRPEAADEARMVAEAAGGLRVPQTTLRWSGWNGAGNLQDVARRARRNLIGDWAEGAGIGVVLTGHTMDDQAETVLMRLSRGSGVDGLSGIAAVRRDRALWARPLLNMRRSELRAWLDARGVAWAEDPSNDDPRFDRVRARRLLDSLSGLGLRVERLSATGHHMQRAREVLDAVAEALARAAVTQQDGDLVIEAGPLAAAAEDTRMRLLAAALQWVSGARYRPRYAALAALAEAPRGVLAGCLVTRAAGAVRITRELAAVRHLRGPTREVWDGRWALEGPHDPALEVRALGREGLPLCPDWRSAALPAASLQATPAIWRGGELVAAPLAGRHRGWRARLVAGRDQFSMAERTR